LTTSPTPIPSPSRIFVPPENASGSQTFYRLIRDIVERERLTFGQLLRRLSGGAGHRIVVGTPEQVADDIEYWFTSNAADGFNVMPDVLPSGFDDFADHLVPELQRRGLFREDYDEPTLRQRLGLRHPTEYEAEVVA
jgi:Coenzyme F420-dependent N5,N10-methylene tetrahydromethanopterin reductase and related flavin-dependent oxidoreductases